LDTKCGSRAPLVTLALVSLALLSLLAATAHGGERPGTDLFAGYSFAKLADVDRHGADLAVGFHLAGPVSGFVDASAHRGSEGSVDRDDLTAMAGPGFRLRRGGTVFFVRALAGIVRDASGISVLDVRITEASTRFGFAAGGGLDLRLAGRWAVRAQADYLWHDADEGQATGVPGLPLPEAPSRSGFRVAAGVVYRFGAKP
jgi:opacity protein-like surface antigen